MKIQRLSPEFLVEDISQTISFYKDILGFEIETIFPEENPIFVQLKKDVVSLMFYVRNEFEKEIQKFKDLKIGGSFSVYFKVQDIDSFYKEIKNKVEIIQDLHETDYGSKEFVIEDCNGYILCFSESVFTPEAV